MYAARRVFFSTDFLIGRTLLTPFPVLIFVTNFVFHLFRISFFLFSFLFRFFLWTGQIIRTSYRGHVVSSYFTSHTLIFSVELSERTEPSLRAFFGFQRANSVRTHSSATARIPPGFFAFLHTLTILYLSLFSKY